LTGVAPEADIMAINIMSKQTSPVTRLWGTFADINHAMQHVNDVSGYNSNRTVSLSIGDGLSNGISCPGMDNVFQTAVNNLNSKKIPVVAATGNSGMTTGVLWPACTPGVIKVGGTQLVANNEVFWSGSNMATPYGHPVLLAPACVYSSGLTAANGGLAGNACGTSASTPHVAGFYALIKQVAPYFSVASQTSWIMLNAAVDTSTNNGQVKRVQIQN
jgi:hypothetical protein